MVRLLVISRIRFASFSLLLLLNYEWFIPTSSETSVVCLRQLSPILNSSRRGSNLLTPSSQLTSSFTSPCLSTHKWNQRLVISTRFPFRILQYCIHYSRYLTIRLSLFLKLSIWSPSRLPFHTISSSPLLLFILDYVTPLLVDVLSRMFDRKGKWRFMNGR